MTWTTAVSDLRTLLSDGPTDRYNSRKRCFGEVNGTNALFRTFEFRRVTNFTQAAPPFGIYIDGILQSNLLVITDYLDTGDFVLDPSIIPSDGAVVEASYYTQWFIDTELQEFLTTASNWLSSQVDYTQTPNGLWPSALKYSAAEAYLKMAQRWRVWQSEMYRVEDEPKKQGQGPVADYIKMSETFRSEALSARDEFYTRQGRALQPLFGSVIGNVRKMP